MIDEHIQPDLFTPSLHIFTSDVRKSFNQLQHKYWNHWSRWNTDWHGWLRTCLAEAIPITMKHYDWVRSEINKLLDAQVIHSSYSSWSAPIIVVPKGDGGKHLVINYRVLNKVTWKFVCKGLKTSFQSWMMLSTSQHSISMLVTSTYPLMKTIPQNSSHISFWKI